MFINDWQIPDFHWLRTEDNTQKFPYYNIGKSYRNKDEVDFYFIDIALAGYNKDEIDITVKSIGNSTYLIINHNNLQPKSDEVVYPHEIVTKRGLSKTSFHLKFELGKNTEVRDAKMENGILRITLDVKIPEEEKPKTFKIK